jgi:hypothetical protein
VKGAYVLLKKPKEARKIHPLFARGFATELVMRVGLQRGVFWCFFLVFLCFFVFFGFCV